MWGTDDITRSARRYLAMLLEEFPGPDDRAWEIRLTRNLVTDQQRPLGVLEQLPHAPGRGRTSVPQGNVQESMGLVFTGYPALLTGDRAVIEGDLRAKRLADALDGLIRFGLSTVVFETGRRACGPQVLPLWDYAAVPVAGVAGPAYPHDVMRAETWSTRSIQDPVDEHRFSVVLTLTVTWERPGRIDPPAPLVTGVPGTFGAAP